jgi:hypothetical protein
MYFEFFWGGVGVLGWDDVPVEVFVLLATKLVFFFCNDRALIMLCRG